ncbi:hypothetical protein RBSWK_01701 [Rhodopirellula baltica SWK14]|uniref:Uncharacterized protein n=1 Tax=Rhodopirellula baltica SWK14 TaxID=993516 RepID=L7CL06_RHOBT|nr:hypothetical protein RBSWK_01701 [Rhodopirellula baltica SWK14]
MPAIFQPSPQSPDSTIYNFTFSIDPPPHRSSPAAAPQIVERGVLNRDLGSKTRG